MISSVHPLAVHSMRIRKTVPRGLDRWANDLVGRYRRKQALGPAWHLQAEKICKQAQAMRKVSDVALHHRLDGYRQTFRRRQRGHERQLGDALASIVEAAERCLGMRPFVEQVLGALLIHAGCLIEMATGEGKTLTAALAAIIAGWRGKPCHIITANDYLAARDAQALVDLYARCGLTTGWVLAQMDPDERRRHYAADIVYTTSKELLADFLRDRLMAGGRFAGSSDGLQTESSNPPPVMRGIHTAIVDEADSVLIDEAVTPLLISQTQKNRTLVEACQAATKVAATLVDGVDYRVDPKYREIGLSRQGRARVKTMAEHLPLIFRGGARREELVQTALAARAFYRKNKHYLVTQGRVVIVDEFTGRMMPQRTWRHGLHQCIEAWEGIDLSDPSETVARLSFQRFFRFFKKLGGMTGTAKESAAEFWHIYGLPVSTLPTHHACQRKWLPNRCYRKAEQKWDAIVAEVIACHASGQPVLIGTRSIAASRHCAGLLDQKKIAYRLLNAQNHRKEARIIANAGNVGTVTIATNMAGRGADIRLGQGAFERGGLHVILSEHHQSRRIDRQLAGRCARQGDPGSVRCYSSLQDELLADYGSKTGLKLLQNFFSGQKPLFNVLVGPFVAAAQKKAQRQAFRQRMEVMRTDEWLTDALSFVRSDPAG